MQIRVANRQDEPAIRAFVESHDKEKGLEFDLSSGDSDLRNIESNYFGRNGIIVVAEQDGQIIGLAAARSKSDSILALRRFLAAPNQMPVSHQLLNTVIAFAPRMLYYSIEVDLYPQSEEWSAIFSEHGFKQCSNSGSWHKGITPTPEPLRITV